MEIRSGEKEAETGKTGEEEEEEEGEGGGEEEEGVAALGTEGGLRGPRERKRQEEESASKK